MQRQSTLADMLALVISPILITLLVSALVCFLVEVFYQGEFNLRLQCIFCLFAMATVCTARISMEEGSAYASLFAFPLGCVMAVALMAYVPYDGPLRGIGWLLNLGMMGVIWWCTHRLTTDSTLVDSATDTTGAGLLTDLGLDGAASAPADVPHEAEPEAVTDSAPTAPESWLEKWLRGDRRPHRPGVWAFYFSIAALPVFGIGQLFIGTTDLAARRWTFQLLVLYVAAALGLLLSTSFLGLRRYLQQRRLELPPAMAAAWLTVGVAMIGGLLFVAFLFPRPAPEYSLAHVLPASKPSERKTSRLAVGNKGKQKPSADRTGTSGEKSDDQGRPRQKDEQQDGGKSDAAGGKEGSSASGNKTDGNKTDGGKAGGDKTGGDKAGDHKQGDAGDKRPQSGAPPDKSSPSKSGDNPPPKQPDRSPSSPPSASQSASAPPPSAEPPPAPPPPAGPSLFERLFGGFADLLNWLGFLIAFAIAGYFAYRYREELKEAWRKLLVELAEFWARLTGRTVQPATEAAAAIVPPAPPPAFASFRDPFASGLARDWSLAELMRYSFQALEAWGRERSCVRSSEQTPGEYAQAVAAAQPAVAAEVRQLAQLYGQVAYGPGAAAQPAAEIVKRFWHRLTTS